MTYDDWKARDDMLEPGRGWCPECEHSECDCLCCNEHCSQGRNQPSGHGFMDKDGDGLCDYETDFPAIERRCLHGPPEHRGRDLIVVAEGCDDNLPVRVYDEQGRSYSIFEVVNVGGQLVINLSGPA